MERKSFGGPGKEIRKLRIDAEIQVFFVCFEINISTLKFYNEIEIPIKIFIFKVSDLN